MGVVTMSLPISNDDGLPLLVDVAQFDETVVQRLRETYTWILSPSQPDPQGDVVWEELKLQPAQEPLAVRASKKLRSEEHLIVQYAPTLLRRDLDRIPLWEGNHVSVKKLWDDYAQYLYLPRLKQSSVLMEAIRDGIASLMWSAETFAYAEMLDETKGRYEGLKAGQQAGVVMNTSSVLVKPEVAQEQFEREREAEPREGKQPQPIPGPGPGPASGLGPQPKVVRRFYGSKELDPIRVAGEAGTIAAEIVQHLTKLSGSRVDVRLEIQAEVPDGVPDDTVRTVSENAQALGFEPFRFEEE